MSHPISMDFHYELTRLFQSKGFVDNRFRPEKDQVVSIDVETSEREVRSLYEELAPRGEKIQLPDQDRYLEEGDVLPLLRALKIERQGERLKRIEANTILENRRLEHVAAESARLLARSEREEKEEQEKQAKFDEKMAWIQENGSPHLKRAAGRGSDCHRKYLTERAEIELPGFVFDWDDNALWGTCACPTEAAMDLLDVLPDECDVVWLKRRHDYNDSYDDGECEVLVYMKYLGSKYDLINYM